MFLKESFEHYCDECGKVVALDQNAVCPSCGSEHLTDIVASALSEDSDDILMFIEDKDGKCINKKNLQHRADGHDPIGDTVPVLRVDKEFFNLLKPDVHDRTQPDSQYGKVIIKNEPEVIQLILKELERYAVPYGELDSKKEAFEPGQRDWKARTKSFTDNELFVDFD